MKYEHRKIGEFCKVIGGYAFKSGDFTDVGIPVLKIKNIEDKSLLLDSLDFLPERFLEIPDKYKVRQGDVLISMTGSHITMPASAVGRVARSRCDDVFLLNQRVGKMQVDKCTCSLDYLYYCMTSAEFKEQIGLRSRGAANQANVSGGDIEGIEIPFPSLPVQKKIAGILAVYDDLIENNLKRITLLEEMAQITYEEWFVRLLFPGHESTPISPETGLPEGWKKEPLNVLSEFIFGFPFKANQFNSVGNGTPIVRIRNIPASSTTDFTTEIVDKKYLIQRGDLLVGMDGDFYINNWTSDAAYLVQRVCNIKPKNKNDLGYITEAIREPIKFYESTICGATVSHLGKKHLDEIMIVVPDERVRKLSHCFNDFLKQKIMLARQVHLLREARDILLPRLMTGVIDVESYDPAQLLKEAA